MTTASEKGSKAGWIRTHNIVARSKRDDAKQLKLQKFSSPLLSSFLVPLAGWQITVLISAQFSA
jgi:hypothetical protein